MLVFCEAQLHGRTGLPRALLVDLTCLLQGLEAPGHIPDAVVKAAATVVTLLFGDAGVAAVHPDLAWDLTLAWSCPNETKSVPRLQIQDCFLASCGTL